MTSQTHCLWVRKRQHMDFAFLQGVFFRAQHIKLFSKEETVWMSLNEREWTNQWTEWGVFRAVLWHRETQSTDGWRGLMKHPPRWRLNKKSLFSTNHQQPPTRAYNYSGKVTWKQAYFWLISPWQHNMLPWPNESHTERVLKFRSHGYATIQYGFVWR